MEDYVVECAACRQPFEVRAPLPPVAVPEPPEQYMTIPYVYLLLPGHEVKGRPGVPCVGEGRQGIFVGRKVEYQGDGAPAIRLPDIR